MMSFSEDTDFARLTLARIASYSVSLLEDGKPNRMACSILSLVGALCCKPTSNSHLARSTVQVKDPLASIIRFHIRLG